MNAATGVVAVIGAGLLGSAVVTEAGRQGHRAVALSGVRWRSDDALEDVQRQLTEIDRARGGRALTVMWTAGRGVPSSPESELVRETRFLDRVLSEVIPALRRDELSVVLASSAGALHSSGEDLVIESSTPPIPLGTYGQHKLEQEQLLAQCAHSHGIRAVAARITNVYGPGQSLSKPQGLITRLCVSAATRQITPITVPLDTQRDFVYVDDAASQLLDLARTVGAPGRSEVGIVASGETVSLHRVIAVVGSQRASGRLLVNCRSTQELSTGHCRFVPTAPGRHRPRRTLESGVHATWQDVLRRLRAGAMPAASVR